MNTTPDDRLLRLDDVIRKTRIGRSTIYRKMAEATFPRPVRVGPAGVRWRESELLKWIAALAPNTNKTE